MCESFIYTHANIHTHTHTHLHTGRRVARRDLALLQQFTRGSLGYYATAALFVAHNLQYAPQRSQLASTFICTKCCDNTECCSKTICGKVKSTTTTTTSTHACCRSFSDIAQIDYNHRARMAVYVWLCQRQNRAETLAPHRSHAKTRGTSAPMVA